MKSTSVFFLPVLIECMVESCRGMCIFKVLVTSDIVVCFK